jgi:hypothetical protein
VGKFYRRVGGARVRSGGDGVGDTRQQVRRRGVVLLAVMAVGALQKGAWGGGSALQRGRGRWC